MYTPVNPLFTIQKWGVRGYKSHGHVILMLLILCGNNQILHRNTPLWFEQLSKSGLKFIKHIWDRDRMDFVEENVVLQRLDNKRNAIKHYRLI